MRQELEREGGEIKIKQTERKKQKKRKRERKQFYSQAKREPQWARKKGR